MGVSTMNVCTSILVLCMVVDTSHAEVSLPAREGSSCFTEDDAMLQVQVHTNVAPELPSGNDSQVKIGSPSTSVDLVYLYINGSDPEHQRLRNEAWKKLESMDEHNHMTKKSNDGEQANSTSHFSDSGELLFSLRSITKFFRGTIRKVFLVTETPPVWLSDKMLVSGELEVVHPRTIMPPGTYPNFNSRAMESNVHKIAGLGDYYMTLNDDVYLGQPVSFDDFLSKGTLKIHMDFRLKYNIDADNSRNEHMNSWNSHRAAMKNANRLLDQRFGHRANRAKISHTPLFWSKAVVRDAHSIFRESLDNTSAHIFRSPFDVHPGFLYSHYILENRSHNGSIKSRIEKSHEEMVVFPLKQHVATYCGMCSKGLKKLPRFFSVNNHMSPAEERHMDGWIRWGLHTLFPDPSKYEDVSLHHLDETPPPNFCQMASNAVHASGAGSDDSNALIATDSDEIAEYDDAYTQAVYDDTYQ